MTNQGQGAPWRRLLVAAALLSAVAFAMAPTGIGFSTGITSTTAGAPADFREIGCTSCHGDHAYSSNEIAWSITDSDGATVPGNTYAHDAEYTITITLSNEIEPGATNHAGFNLAASAGVLHGVEGISQASDDGLEATHVDGASTTWTVGWTAPAEGVVVFDLFVNDVDGSNSPDPADAVDRRGWFLTDEHGAQPGAVEEEEVHVGVPLPQYWLGLIALAGMVFIMLFGFVYLKFANPHNADQKDR